MQNVQDKTVSRYLCKFADSPNDTTNLEHSAIELLQFFFDNGLGATNFTSFAARLNNVKLRRDFLTLYATSF
jgi:hypothetical protein